MSAPLPPVRQLDGRPVLDARPSPRRIGLIVLATDHTTERDFARMVASQGIAVHAARIAYANPTTPENLAKMQPRLGEAAALILPDEALDAVCFSCSSASVVIGDAAVTAAVAAAKPGAPVVTPPLATVRALQALGAKRISILTPYTADTTAPMSAYMAAKDFNIVSTTCLGLEDDREMARIPPASLVAFACEATDAQADALFVSCTALRAAEAAAAIETAIGRPVVTSNQATCWNILRLCGVAASRPEWGRLMTLPLCPDAAP